MTTEEQEDGKKSAHALPDAPLSVETLDAAGQVPLMEEVEVVAESHDAATAEPPLAIEAVMAEAPLESAAPQQNAVHAPEADTQYREEVASWRDALRTSFGPLVQSPDEEHMFSGALAAAEAAVLADAAHVSQGEFNARVREYIEREMEGEPLAQVEEPPAPALIPAAPVTPASTLNGNGKKGLASFADLAGVRDQIATVETPARSAPVIEQAAIPATTPVPTPTRASKPESVVVPDARAEQKEKAVSELNEVGAKLATQRGVIRESNEDEHARAEKPRHTQDEVFVSRRTIDRLNDQAQLLAFEIAEPAVLFGIVKTPDIRALAVRRDIKTLPPEEKQTVLAAKDRTRKFAATLSGVNDEMAAGLYREFLRHAKSLDDIPASGDRAGQESLITRLSKLKEGEEPVLSGKDAHLLHWYQISKGSWKEVAAQLVAHRTLHNDIPPPRTPHEALVKKVVAERAISSEERELEQYLKDNDINQEGVDFLHALLREKMGAQKSGKGPFPSFKDTLEFQRYDQHRNGSEVKKQYDFAPDPEGILSQGQVMPDGSVFMGIGYSGAKVFRSAEWKDDKMSTATRVESVDTAATGEVPRKKLPEFHDLTKILGETMEGASIEEDRRVLDEYIIANHIDTDGAVFLHKLLSDKYNAEANINGELEAFESTLNYQRYETHRKPFERQKNIDLDQDPTGKFMQGEIIKGNWVFMGINHEKKAVLRKAEFDEYGKMFTKTETRYLADLRKNDIPAPIAAVSLAATPVPETIPVVPASNRKETIPARPSLERRSVKLPDAEDVLSRIDDGTAELEKESWYVIEELGYSSNARLSELAHAEWGRRMEHDIALAKERGEYPELKKVLDGIESGAVPNTPEYKELLQRFAAVPLVGQYCASASAKPKTARVSDREYLDGHEGIPEEYSKDRGTTAETEFEMKEGKRKNGATSSQPELVEAAPLSPIEHGTALITDSYWSAFNVNRSATDIDNFNKKADGFSLEGEAPVHPFQDAYWSAFDKNLSPVGKKLIEEKTKGMTLDPMTPSNRVEGVFDASAVPLTERAKVSGEVSVLTDRLSETLDINLNFDGKIDFDPTLAAGAASKSTETDEQIMAKISPIVAEEFRKTFNQDEKDLAKIPEFSALTEGQQLLVRNELNNHVVSQIKAEALKTYRDKYASLHGELNKVEQWAVERKGFFGKVLKIGVGIAQMRHKETWQKIGMGILKTKLTIEGEKELAKAMFSGEVDHTEYIRELSRRAKEGPDAKLVNGKLQLEFLRSEDFGNEGLTPKEVERVKVFNKMAAAYGVMPHSWKETGATPWEQDKYKEMRYNYKEALDEVLPILERKGNTESALIDANELERRISFTQLFNTHPEAAEQLAAIKDQNVWWGAAKDIAATKGTTFAIGASVRSVAAAIAAATGAAIGVFAAPVTGAATGAYVGHHRAVTELKERELLAKMGVKDESEEAMNIVDAVVRTKSETTGQILNQGLAGKLEELTTQILALNNDETEIVHIEGVNVERNKKQTLLDRLERRIAYTEQKLREQKVNYGEGVDRIKNQNALLEALRDAKATEMFGRNKHLPEEMVDTATGERFHRDLREDRRTPEERLAGLLNLREQHISEAQKKYILQTTKQAAYYGAAFAFGGALVADVIHGAVSLDDMRQAAKGGATIPAHSASSPALHSRMAPAAPPLAAAPPTPSAPIPRPEVATPAQSLHAQMAMRGEAAASTPEKPDLGAFMEEQSRAAAARDVAAQSAPARVVVPPEQSVPTPIERPHPVYRLRSFDDPAPSRAVPKTGSGGYRPRDF